MAKGLGALRAPHVARLVPLRLRPLARYEERVRSIARRRLRPLARYEERVRSVAGW